MSACADTKEPAAAHPRASSKRVGRLFRPFGPDALRQTQKAAFAAHGMPASRASLKGIAEPTNLDADQSQVIRECFPCHSVSDRDPIPCRGRLTQTAGRGVAETPGEGRPNRAVSVKLKKPHRDLQAMASTRRLKRRNAARQMRRASVVARSAVAPTSLCSL